MSNLAEKEVEDPVLDEGEESDDYDDVEVRTGVYPYSLATMLRPS